MATRTTSSDGLDAARLMHELEVHQAELEAQNHELRGINDELGVANAAVGVARDRYRTLYDRAPVAYVTLASQGTIHEINRAAEVLFGVPRPRLVGAQMGLFIDDFGRRAFRAFLDEVVETGHARSPDLRLLREDAQPIDVMIEGMAIQTAAEDERDLVLALVDISARKAVETARRRAQDEVLAVVSHDLRGPLNAIVLACDAVRAGLSPAELAEHVTGIERAAKRCTRLIKDLLGVVHIESGALVLERSWFDLGELVRALVSDHAAAAAAAGCELTSAIGGGRLMVHADRDRIHQIGANLLTNAIVHAPGSPVEISAADGGDVVILAVADQGPGIGADEQARVFDRFLQAGRGHTGVGLGLAIVKGLVTAHRGTVRLESTPGHGARFEVALPRGD